jgi:phosphoglycolate phosphatase-like HAD superfamily hydrolase
VTLLVLFDVDRTLFLSSDSLYGEALAAAVGEVYGLQLGEDAFARTDNAGETARAGVRKLLAAEGVDDATIDAGLAVWTERLTDRYLELLSAADTSHWKAAPGAAETLEQLGREHRLALLTGNPERMARARMERLGLDRYFGEGQGGFGSDGEHRADLIGIARERAGGWPAERTVLIGDTPRDVAGAREAGVRAVGVTLGRFGADELADADAVVSSLPELPRALHDVASTSV